MNEIFAIEPTAFEDYKDCLLLERFGFHEGRFIAEYPRKWRRAVYEHLDRLPDVKRKQAIESFEKYSRDRFAPVSFEFAPTKPWLENAKDLKRIAAVADVIFARNNAGDFPTPDNVDHKYFSKLGGRQTEVLSSASGYADAAKMLLLLSHEIVVVDPYFGRLDNRYQRVFERFVQTALSGRRCRSFVFFSMEDGSTSLEQMRRGAKQFFSSATRQGIDIKFHVLRDTGKQEADNHGRFLISIKGALKFDRGFDEEKIPRLRKVDALDTPMHDKLCRQYLEGELPFEVVQMEYFPRENRSRQP